MPGRVQLEPLFSKIGVIGAFVMIVLEQLSHHQQVERQAILAVIIVVIIGIAIFVSAPIDGRPVDRPHEEMDRQQQEHPPMGGENYIESSVQQTKTDPGHP